MLTHILMSGRQIDAPTWVQTLNAHCSLLIANSFPVFPYFFIKFVFDGFFRYGDGIIADEAIDDDNGECIIYSKKPKMSSAKKHRIRKIHIKYDFIGFIPVKSLMRYAEESKQAQSKEISA